MGTTPEGKVGDALKREVSRAGGLLRKMSWEGRAGAPDWLVLFPALGIAFMAELKAPGEVPPPHQLREHDLLRRSGLRVHVVDGPEAIRRMMEGELGLRQRGEGTPRTDFSAEGEEIPGERGKRAKTKPGKARRKM